MKDTLFSPKGLKLKATAKELFFKYGVKRVTVEEICAKAGVSKVTFYKYFSDKFQLAALIRDELTEEGFAKFDEINALDVSYPEKINRMTRWRTEFFSAITHEFIEDVMNMEDLYEEVKKRYLKNIRSAQEKGEIRGDLSPELIWLVSEKLNEIVKDGSWKEISPDLGEFQKQLRALYFWGLLTRPE